MNILQLWNASFDSFLSGATDGKVSQLERLVFSENFVKEVLDVYFEVVS